MNTKRFQTGLASLGAVLGVLLIGAECPDLTYQVMTNLFGLFLFAISFSVLGTSPTRKEAAS